jgi:hypothetical protein
MSHKKLVTLSNITKMTGSKVAIHWTIEDENAFVDYLIAHKAEGGIGMNFKPSVWTAAAHMQPLMTKGGQKSAEKCKAKWSRVHPIHFGYFF